MHLGDGVSFKVTRIYESPDKALRKHSWDLMRRLKGCFNPPWMLIGDFSEILDRDEEIGEGWRPESQLDCF